MKFETFLFNLSMGVLNNTMYSRAWKDGVGIEALVPLIEEGLTRLYSRFILREKHVIIEMRVGTTFYHFKRMFSVTGADPIQVPYPYIMDLPGESFVEDVIKILSVHDTQNVLRPLNDPNQINSVFTPQPDILQNPYPRELEALMVTYQAGPEPLYTLNGDGNVELVGEFYLPPVLVPALANYVAYMVYSRINTAESSAKAASHLQIYEMICKDAEMFDLVNNSKSSTNLRFGQNGWA